MTIEEILEKSKGKPVKVVYRSWKSGAYLRVTKRSVQAFSPHGAPISSQDLVQPYESLDGDGWELLV